MKSSELIKKLQEIDKTVPFDADVVTGDDIMPTNIINVFHEPPHTFLEFESLEDEDSIDKKSIAEILDNYKNSVIIKR